MSRDRADTPPASALGRHLPILRYDSRQRGVAIAVHEWITAPGCRLVRTGDRELAGSDPGPGQARLELAFLGPTHYGDGTPAQAGDRLISAPRFARPLDQPPAREATAATVYGRAVSGSDNRLWLTYWFFYAYNDYTLLGPLVGAGRHEGDWEMIELRLGEDGEPDLLLATQHSRVVAMPWSRCERVGPRPVIYPARGDHASYLDPGLRWTGHWFDHVDGRGAQPACRLVVLDEADDQGWVHWPGRWGGTLPGAGIGHRLGFDASSPRGPGHQRQWRDPARLLADISAPRTIRAAG